MTDIYTILLHSNLVPGIRKAAPPVRHQVQKTLERLQLGYWGQGTRVKLLKGVGKPVYEARVNRDHRLLFTVVRSHSAAPPHPFERFLLVWDLVVHDRLDRPRRRNLEPEAGFLDFEELSAFALPDTPAHPELLLPEDGWSADEVSRRLDDRTAPAAEADELTDSIRWFRIDPDIVLQDREWQELIDGSDAGDLELKLSLEQAQVVHAPGPVLLRGTAGSGKTTASVYRLARAAAEHPHDRILYVTYSDALLAAVERLFTALFAARRIAPPKRPPEFRTFTGLYDSLTGDDYAAGDVLRFPVFERWYRRTFRTDDAALAWEEIRSIVKGACLDPARDALTFREYELLGRKRAPLFSSERPRIYKVFGKYREWCHGKKRFDDIDLARRALAALRRSPDHVYHQVVCDEGQDLTELELRFLLELVPDSAGLFFAADPQQVVNPSGFRWAEIRTLLWTERKGHPAPEIRSLTRNYRSVQSIVGLANRFLEIQRDRTGRCDDDDFQQATLRGPAPVLVGGREEQVLDHLRDFGPRCAVITRTPEEARRLGRSLQSERVFDVFGVKGLEFDGCVLVNLFGPDLDIWKRILLGNAPLKEDPVARRAIHHAYVAVTRARRHLAVYESSPEAIELWSSSWFRGQIERDEPAGLARFMVNAASPAEWSREARYYLDRKRYRQAAECYRRAGDTRRERLALATFHREVEDFRAAAPLYRKLGMHREAAECFEKSRQLREAAREFVAAGDRKAAGRLLEATGQWLAAAQAHEEMGNAEQAARARMRHHAERKEWQQAAESAVAAGQAAAAAEYYRKAGAPEQALKLKIEAARREKDHGTLARLLEESGDYKGAERSYKRLRKPRDAARCRALAAEAAGDLEGAYRRYRRMGDRRRAEQMREKIAAREQKELKARARAAEKRGDVDTAIEAFSEAGDAHRAGILLAEQEEKSGDLMAAAESWLLVDRPADAARCLDRSDDPLVATFREAQALRRSGDSFRAAVTFADAGRHMLAGQAADRFLAERSAKVRGSRSRFRDEEEIYEDYRAVYWARRFSVAGRMRLLARQGRREEAVKLRCLGNDPETERFRASLYEQLGDERSAGRAHLNAGDFDRARAAYERAGDEKGKNRALAMEAESRNDPAAAAKHWALSGAKTKALKAEALYHEGAGRYLEAARCYEDAKMPAQARRCRSAAGLPPATQPPRPQQRDLF